MPPTAPAMPPIPTTDATAREGNMSEGKVKRFAENPWCPAAASPMSNVAGHSPETRYTTATGNKHKEQTNIAHFRAAFTEKCRRMSAEESHPPPILPRSEMT